MREGRGDGNFLTEYIALVKARKHATPQFIGGGGMKQPIQGYDRAQDRKGIGNQVET